jgi:hypothetical protein
MIHKRLTTGGYITVALTTVFICTFIVSSIATAKTKRSWMEVSSFEKAATSSDLTALYRALRAAISQNQSHINNANIGNKGLTGKRVVQLAKENYRKSTGSNYVQAAGSTMKGKAQYAFFEATEEVMKKAQSLINQRGTGFKGFLPAIFAGQLATKFNGKMEGIMSIKLTAPRNLIRNPKNSPDGWEANIIEGKFNDFPGSICIPLYFARILRQKLPGLPRRPQRFN